MQKQNVYWPAVFLFALLGFGAFGFLGTAVVMATTSIGLVISKDSDPVGMMNLGIGFALEAIVLGIATFYVLRKMMKSQDSEMPTHFDFARWHIVVVLIIAAILVGIGELVVEIKWVNLLMIPIFTSVAIIFPIWAFMNMGIFNLELGPRWRAWAIFGLGMTLGPLIMVILEVAMGATLVIILGIFLASQPDMLVKLQTLLSQIQSLNDPDMALQLLTPYLLNPVVLGVAYLYIALLVPMVEEIFKPIGIWIFARQIRSAAQGFALGLLSGAAYALVESIGVSNQSGVQWGAVVTTRAGTSLLHITTTGLMGWAIASAWRDRRYLRLFLTYVLSITMHGLWNASAITIAVLSLAIGNDFDRAQIVILVASTVILFLLVVSMISILLIGNKCAKEANASTLSSV